jgi:Rieske Fe-S protein
VATDATAQRVQHHTVDRDVSRRIDSDERRVRVKQMTGSSNEGCVQGGCDQRGCAARVEELSSINRRSFILQSALLTASAALAACGTSGDVSAPALPSTGNTVNINNTPALTAVGGVALVSIGGVPLAIVRTGAASFLALSRICPHQGGTIQQSGSGFQCPVHGATFSQAGQWIGGQRTSSMHGYATSYDATSGILTIS